MTREEAKRRLLDIERCTPIHTREDARDFEALEMAISALNSLEEVYAKGYNDGFTQAEVNYENDKALSQEPCTDAVSREAVLDTLDRMDKTLDVDRTVENYKDLLKESYQVLPSVNPQPCEDAISRDMALEKMADYVASGYADSAEDFEEYSRIICQLPSVNPQKSGKWKVVSDGYGNSETAYICECSECKDTVWVYKDADRQWNFCPNCGACMKDGRTLDEFIKEQTK